MTDESPRCPSLSSGELAPQAQCDLDKGHEGSHLALCGDHVQRWEAVSFRMNFRDEKPGPYDPLNGEDL